MQPSLCNQAQIARVYTPAGVNVTASAPVRGGTLLLPEARYRGHIKEVDEAVSVDVTAFVLRRHSYGIGFRGQ